MVADETPVAHQIQATLLRMGYDVPATPCTGDEAPARVESDHPDLVLMDVRLRRGVDAIEKARRLLFKEGPPIVYLADQREPQREPAAEGRSTGLDLLQAPFSDQGLRTAIELAIHRHAVERSLREAVDLFSITFDEAPIGMALSTLDDRYLRVNRALCSILGFSHDELMSMRWRQVTHPADVATDAELREQLTAGTIPRYQLVKRYLRKDGAVIEGLLAMSLMRDPDGTPSTRSRRSST